jgi:hypothetical protein
MRGRMQRAHADAARLLRCGYEEHSRQDVLSYQDIAGAVHGRGAQQPAMVQGWEFSKRGDALYLSGGISTCRGGRDS